MLSCRFVQDPIGIFDTQTVLEHSDVDVGDVYTSEGANKVRVCVCVCVCVLSLIHISEPTRQS